jgi:hypothetical protein
MAKKASGARIARRGRGRPRRSQARSCAGAVRFARSFVARHKLNCARLTGTTCILRFQLIVGFSGYLKYLAWSNNASTAFLGGRRPSTTGFTPSPAHFTTGELAVLRIVGDEVRQHGACALYIDAIAARAGVCRTTAQNAIREAERSAL